MHMQVIVSSKVQQKSSGNVVFMHTDAISYSVTLAFFNVQFYSISVVCIANWIKFLQQLDRRDVWIEHSEVLKRL